MHRSILFIAVTVMALLMMQPPAAGASDTSPYLAGTWGSAIFGQTPFGPPINYFIGNPTIKALDVYAAFYTYDGVFTECVTTTLQPNGSWYLFDETIRGAYTQGPGTVKFFAFPAGTRKLDPNAIIGGFQQELLPNFFVIGPSPYIYGCQVLEVNLKAVTINSSTIGEFSKLPAYCPQWVPPRPPGYPPGIFCNGLIEPTG